MVFFKYFIRFLRRHYFKFFIFLGIFIMFLFVFGLYNNVFGYTTWTAPDGDTYNIPDYTLNSNYQNYMIICGKSADTQTKKVILFQTNYGQFALQQRYLSEQYPSLTFAKNLGDGTSFNLLTSQATNNNTTWNERNNDSLTANSGWNGNLPTAVFNDDYCFIYSSNQNIDLYNENREKIKNVYSNTIEPYIENSSTDIEDWSFDNLSINLGTLGFNENDVLIFTYNNIEYSLFLKDYVETVGAGNITNPISIPIAALNNYIVFTENADITFEYGSVVGVGNVLKYNMGTYTITLSTTKVNELNDNADRNIQNAILDKTEETNQQLQNLNDSINDDNIDVTANDLPSIDVNSPTENGLNNIFQNLYNAFCTGQAQDIVFPIPFTNKNITLSPYYVRDMLNNNNASWVYTFIQAFWGYLIGRYIIKDITSKIDKIKSGDVENVENSNIKEDML